MDRSGVRDGEGVHAIERAVGEQLQQSVQTDRTQTVMLIGESDGGNCGERLQKCRVCSLEPTDHTGVEGPSRRRSRRNERTAGRKIPPGEEELD